MYLLGVVRYMYMYMYMYAIENVWRNMFSVLLWHTCNSYCARFLILYIYIHMYIGKHCIECIIMLALS